LNVTDEFKKFVIFGLIGIALLIGCVQFTNYNEVLSRPRRTPTQETYGFCRINNFAYIAQGTGRDLKCRITAIETAKNKVAQIKKIRCIPHGVKICYNAITNF
jgi:hypothetical protein